MATVNNQTMEKHLTVSGEQIEDIIKKSAEIEKNTADIKEIKKALTENGGNLDLTEITERVDKLGADYTKLNDLVVTNAADIASNKTRLNNFRNTTKPIEEVTYTKEETDAAITAKVAEIVSGAPDDFDTLKEMSDWLTIHENSAAAMNSAIVELSKSVSEIKAEIETVSTNIKRTDIKNGMDLNTLDMGEGTTASDYKLFISTAKAITSTLLNLPPDFSYSGFSLEYYRIAGQQWCQRITGATYSTAGNVTNMTVYFRAGVGVQPTVTWGDWFMLSPTVCPATTGE